jgi:hypothetical protein
MELVISMAITAIVLSMIIMIINTATHGFKNTNEDVNLQMEAQIAMNQLSSLLMEASEKIDPVRILTAPDAKYIFKCRTDEYYSIIFKQDKNRLYLVQKSTAGEADNVDPFASTDLENQYLLAKYVSSFAIDLSTGGKSAQISIDFKLGDENYTVSKKVRLRNVK